MCICIEQGSCSQLAAISVKQCLILTLLTCQHRLNKGKTAVLCGLKVCSFFRLIINDSVTTVVVSASIVSSARPVFDTGQ